MSFKFFNPLSVKFLLLCVLTIFIIYACGIPQDVLPSLSGISSCPSCPPCFKNAPLKQPSPSCPAAQTPVSSATNESGEPIVISSGTVITESPEESAFPSSTPWTTPPQPTPVPTPTLTPEETVTYITVLPTSVELMAAGDGQSFNVTAYDKDGRRVNNVNFEWMIFDKSVAEVDNFGRVTALGIGSTTLRVSTNKGKVTAYVTIIVRSPKES